ncbi:MAG: Glycosyltransferase involved in cell wall bisynthesis [Candidatus Electronema aureum]|uniref:Glycosyltransferase involved in cell wall bisynthesis n=1 Tax=Candidatus Electronema aureum TaxID=2005002 RepID=A0A521G1R0_9BACT|nr:MAG: Glycosyltransferase involved in cell wall bisynthesis [Candidatus Electronema aureum]
MTSRYTSERIAHWNRIATNCQKGICSKFYHELLCHYYKFFVPLGLRILEIGSGEGDLLHKLQPKRGLGIDFSANMVSRASSRYPELEFICANAHLSDIHEQFDIIILSDILNDCEDVQKILMNIKKNCHEQTRIIINYFNNLWRVPLAVARRLKLARPLLEQNWLTPQDIKNFLALSGFEEISRKAFIALSVPVSVLSKFLNRFIIHLFPFNLLALTNFSISRPVLEKKNISNLTTSVIVAVRNEAGNIEELLNRIPEIGKKTEIIFVEGGSSDNTYETIEQAIVNRGRSNISLYRQHGKGKGDAVRLGFQMAIGDAVLILDADMTVKPEELPRFVQALVDGQGEFINGVRLVYPMEDEAMRFFNIIGNKFFSIAFSWLLNQQIKDTLCGTKVMWKSDYEMLAKNRHYFGEFDPFGDFDFIFGAAKMNLKIIDLPIRYQARRYGTTNISRWRNGLTLLKMVIFASRKIKFI